MSKTAQGLVSFCRSKIGTPYVYGAKGQVMTKQAILNLKHQYPSYVRDSDLAKAGKACTDCSGLISWYTGIIRGSENFKDTATISKPIAQRNNSMIGWGLWKMGHIGVYIGNDKYIAADGSAVGTREAFLYQNSFTHIIKLRDIDYSTGATSGSTNGTGNTKPPAAAEPNDGSIVNWLAWRGLPFDNASLKRYAAEYGIKDYKHTAAQNTKLLALMRADNNKTNPVGMCLADCVNVRTGAGLQYTIIRQVNKGNLFDILGTSNGWTNVNIEGTKGWIYNQYVARV